MNTHHKTAAATLAAAITIAALAGCASNTGAEKQIAAKTTNNPTVAAPTDPTQKAISDAESALRQ